MDLYNMPDIRDCIQDNIRNKNLNKLNSLVFDFLKGLNTSHPNIIQQIATEFGFNDNPAAFLAYWQNVFQTEPDYAMKIAQTIADYSDNEKYCSHKIYVVIKNFYGTEFVKEYNFWDEAELDVDDWYIGCCDDAFLAENMLYPILCSIREREYDYTMNFCTVIEFNAYGIEDCREFWEEENC